MDRHGRQDTIDTMSQAHPTIELVGVGERGQTRTLSCKMPCHLRAPARERHQGKRLFHIPHQSLRLTVAPNTVFSLCSQLYLVSAYQWGHEQPGTNQGRPSR